MILFVNIGYFLKWKFIDVMTFSVADHDTWDDGFLCFFYMQGGDIYEHSKCLHSIMQEEDIHEHNNVKCHFFTLLVDL